MAKLSGIEGYQVDEAKDALVLAWENAFKSLRGLGKLEHYKEFAKHRFLGSLDFLISQINPDGTLDTDAALEQRKEESGFNLEIYQRAVDELVKYWPDVASLIVQIG